jgi:hypothetical protein
MITMLPYTVSLLSKFTEYDDSKEDGGEGGMEITADRMTVRIGPLTTVIEQTPSERKCKCK